MRIAVWLLALCALLVPAGPSQPPPKERLFIYEVTNGFAGSWSTLIVYTDGQVITLTDHGLGTLQLSPERLQRFTAEAAAAIEGIGEAHDCEAEDLSVATFGLYEKGRELYGSVYGLGCGKTPRLKALAAFQGSLFGMRAEANTRYVPDLIQVVVSPANGQAEDPWPLAEYPPTTFPNARPLWLPGKHAERLAGPRPVIMPQFYSYEGKTYRLRWRPELP